MLVVERLTTVFEAVPGRRSARPADARPAVDDVSFVVGRGETVALVGESGCGKSVTALSLLRLVQPPGRIVAGQVIFEGRDLLALPEAELRTVRGRRLALVFQEPMSALNPVFTAGEQVAEALIVHGASRERAWAEAERLLDVVRLPDPKRAARAYPHELSGGMRQRVLVAAALACRPALLVADEPTTALDAAVQAEILELLREMKQAFDLSLLLITHDLRVVRNVADRVLVMQRGRLVEQAATEDLFSRPQHPDTKSLLASTSASGVGEAGDRPALSAEARPAGEGRTSHLLEVRNLVKAFDGRGAAWRAGRPVRAVDDVSFSIEEGEIFGLVGESGSGKSTVARSVLRLVRPTAGEIRFRGENLLEVSPARMRALRREMQVVFQDPFSSLNPRMRVGAIVEEPLVIHGRGTKAERRARVESLFRLVEMDPAAADRYPHEFSGGERQRLVLARALALEPAFLVADEPVSALDASVQAQVVQLLVSLQRRLGLTCLLIAHDLRLVERICPRVGVMYRGRIVEMGRTEQIFSAPAHPYTRALLGAVRQG